MRQLLALAALIALCSPANASESLRCKGGFIDPGDTMAEVIGLCGQPAERVQKHRPVRARSINGLTRIVGWSADEKWVYEPGWGYFAVALHFFDGRVQRIERLSYRSGEK